MKITWFGHSAFRLDFGGKAVLIDPFFTGNPSFPGDMDGAIAGVSHILVTHGHGDHVGDTLAIAQRTGAKVVTNYDLGMHLVSQGLQALDPMNTGGTTRQDGFSVTMVRADHSAGMGEAGVQVPVGSANGLIVKPDQGPSVYHLGDTDIFSDMALINELWAPDIGLVPIGDRFTMSPRTAAIAVRRFFSFKAVIPCHYGTFPIIEPDATAFAAALSGHPTRVIVPERGKAVEV
jgi:L-ascorbate metabolism protein UlaG (beta-lactamase superfamily)